MMQNSYNITDQEVAYIANLHKNVKELHIYELISLRTTSYLLDTRSVVIATTQWKICSCGENMETTTHYLLQCNGNHYSLPPSMQWKPLLTISFNAPII